MSYASTEVSREEGQPIRLYQFQRGPIRYSYTGADRVISLNNTDFAPSQISDSGIIYTGQSEADPITISLPSDSEISLEYRILAPDDEITLTIWDWHYGVDDFLVSFVGSILGAKWPTAYSCEITVWSLTASLDKPGLRLCWQPGCPHSLYDKNCTVNPQAFRVDGSVQGFNGLTVTVLGMSAMPDGWFSGGYLEWTDSNNIINRRGIRAHIGQSLVLLGGTFSLLTGLAVSVYPGCARTTAVCTNKFNNLDNFGGAPGMPGKSPFDGNPVF